MEIQWFPGHMAKAHRMIKEHLKLVDVVIELLDARIPVSSANPMIHEVIENKPRILVLNKEDLAEPEWTERWVKYFTGRGLPVVKLNSATGRGMRELVGRVEAIGGDKMARLAAKGIKGRAIRAMILGIPNVGKSSLINRLLGTAAVRTADKPGVTRGKQWIRIGKTLELLDTPGVLWPKLEDADVAFKLALTGAINDDVYDLEKVIHQFLAWLKQYHSERLLARYQLSVPLPVDDGELLGRIGAKRGCLRSGGIIDYEKAGKIVLQEFRAGKLGPITLDYPPEPVNQGNE
ncbi:Hypothetical protein LUCI_0849 [Lucifera butyrica]|uniref:Ribosome biogenesis GTPase A n=1 Tax=Lucifera butyrica TaxID=1351585 RepID=A0A498R389_9FIRM|nr:ribosome biogenesis GTPase YlqF [Lucifera butyrica]VBB05639.1 Hypothetical protein LUCI_0849 [Lucifera butyrica]